VTAARPLADETDDGDATRASSARATRRWLLELLAIVLVGLLLSWGVRAFLVRSFSIPSGSMEQTLMIGDRILVNELAPRVLPLHRGDVVVFVDPGGWLGYGDAAGQDLVKRVVGLPGDHVSCCDADGHVLVNGEPLDEPYLTLVDGGPRASATDFDVTVPEGALWVLGDNRDRSADSRAHQTGPYEGFVPVDDVIGRAFVVAWPIDRWQRL
jgi:signal peptidase I